MPSSFFDQLAQLDDAKEKYMSDNGEQWHSYLTTDTSLMIASADLEFRHFIDGDGMGEETDVTYDDSRNEDEDDLGSPTKKKEIKPLSGATSPLKKQFDTLIGHIKDLQA